ncbi:MAG: hypothetical protein GOV00_00405 [Candidatus Altiarchaeota archaeon]|nr:hypothetical protein [Candidatus Altiarchaeota archaeon]
MNDEQYKGMSNSIRSAHEKVDELSSEMERKFKAVFEKLNEFGGNLVSLSLRINALEDGEVEPNIGGGEPPCPHGLKTKECEECNAWRAGK